VVPNLEGVARYQSVQVERMISNQEQIFTLSALLQNNSNINTGLSGAESLMGLDSRVEELTQRENIGCTILLLH